MEVFKVSQFKCVQAAEHVIVNREKLAREARQNGRIVIGHYCCTFPRELITAVGAVPYRITGDVEETPSCLLYTSNSFRLDFILFIPPVPLRGGSIRTKVPTRIRPTGALCTVGSFRAGQSSGSDEPACQITD